MDNDAVAEERMQSIPFQLRWVFQCLLSAAAKQNKKGRLEIGFGYFCRFYDIPSEAALAGIEAAEKAGLFVADRATDGSRPPPVHEPDAPRTDVDVSREGSQQNLDHTYERTNVTNGECGDGGQGTLIPEEPEDSGAAILFRLWNQHCGDLPKAISLSEKRKKSAGARWDEVPKEQYWEEVVKRLAASAFCNGKNDRAWKADFDFLLQTESHIRTMEGKYDALGQGGAGPRGKPVARTVTMGATTPSWQQQEQPPEDVF